VGAFDGIDPVQEQAIRRALEKEIRLELKEELSADIRRKVERDIRAETRHDVLAEIAERTPSDEDRETFASYVNEVRLDAYAQATMASEVADHADATLEVSRSWATPLTVVLLVALPLLFGFGSRWLGGFYSAGFVATAIAASLFFTVFAVSTLRRHHRLEREVRANRKIASDFLIIAERAKAFAMVHAERLATRTELDELIEDLRKDKERQDRAFHPSAPQLEAARERVRPRIAEENRKRIAIALDEREQEDAEAATRAKRHTRR
jgi:hypothetical protein